jgi:amino acid adenylation domain-containing protein
MSSPGTAGFQLSPQQKHIWSLQQDQQFFAQIAVLLEGKLDQQRLHAALMKIYHRHEILRTVFQRNPGMKFPFQVVNANATFSCFRSALAEDATEESQLQDALEAQAEADLLDGIAFNVALIDGSQDRHFVLFTLPAMCADAGTLGNLVQELREFYAEPTSAASDPLQYADYSEWQNELLQKNDEESAAGKAFWKKHDISRIPPLVLPFESKSKPGTRFAPESVAVPVESSTWDELDSATDDPSAWLLAAWQGLLWRLTGQAEFALGVVSDGRSHEELTAAIGLFSKALPLYCNFEQDTPFADLVKSARSAYSDAVDHLDFLELSGNDLPVGFSVEELPSEESDAELTFSVYAQRCEINRFHLQLKCIEQSGSWKLNLVYDPEKFQIDIVERIAQRFAMLFAAAVTNPALAISALPIMDEGERQQVLVSFNQTVADYSRDKAIQQLFEEQAALKPNVSALRCGEQHFTYTELNARANQLAHLLRNRGVKNNVPVGLCVERSADMIIGVMGILKAGGCYVPLVPDNPKSRLAHQITEINAPVVVTQQHLLERLPEFAGSTICLDRDASLLNQEPTANPGTISHPDDLVYVIYTSGSTGVPKGVAVRHRNLVNYSQFICKRLGLENYPEGLNFATVSTISADLGNTCIFPALISGGCLHVIPYEMAMAANLYAKHVAAHPIDVLKITPSHFTTLLNAPEGTAVIPRKFLILGGEASSWHLLDRIQQASDCTVINHYGPTEATVGCCTFNTRESNVSMWNPATIPIGTPIANDEIYVLDQRLEPAPVGVAGELCIGGAGLAQGYWNQPEQTADRFIPHPFSKEPGARLYRTGDLARFLPDGNIEFMGRIDHQVKIRGFRVEPAEIEAMVKQYPSVKQNVVLPYEDQSGEKRLAAYVVAEKPIKAEDLRAFLLQQLPEYMVPSAFLMLDSIPLTANGKVDMRALPSAEHGQSQAEREFISPRTPEEEKVVAIWTEVLKLDRISVNDNFFELGGHSLLATQIISRIRNVFRVQMPLHSFLETPTIAGLAEKISQCPPAESEEEEMARLLQELDGLSDEEAERLLATDTQPGKRPAGSKEP